MNTYFKTIATAMVTFSMLLSVAGTPLSVVAFTFDSTLTNWGSNTDTSDDSQTAAESTTNEESAETPESASATSGQSASATSGSYTKCVFSSDAYEIKTGGSVRLNWDTKGYDSLSINGQSVSGETGSKVFSNIQENTKYVFEGLNSDGNNCYAEVVVNCLPPDVPKYCELDIEKTVNKHTAVVGEEVTYTIKVQNIGTADCTGGGVKIFDVLDPNLVYKSNTVSSNLSAGYGNSPVYTNTDRTLRFNGHDLTPGESGTITWTGVVAKPTTCGDFEVKNQAKTTAKELNNFKDWTYSEVVKTAIDYDCVVEKCVDFDTEKWKVKATLTSNEANQFSVKFENPTDCEIEVGATSYKVPVDEAGELCGWENRNLDCQVRYDYEDIVLKPHATQEVVVMKPSKCYQLDWYYGKSVETIDYSGNPANSYVGRLIDAVLVASVADCTEIPKEKTATVVAHKIVCTDEAQLPNYGKGGPNMTANTAADWVATHDTCSLVSGWEFQWTDSQSSDPGDTLTGKAGSPWTSFGPTDSTGKTSTVIDINKLTNNRVWFREVLQAGYIPFTHGQNAGTNVDDVSAEFYCNSDVMNYDNYDFINSLEDGKTYHCVAWNSPIPDVPAPSCDMFTATPGTITVGDKTLLEWKTSNAVQVFLNNAIGAVGLNDSIEVSPVETTTYVLTVVGEEDKKVTCEVPVTVSKDSVPVCEFFIATPGALPVGGGDVTLSWKVTDAVSASIAPTIGAVSLVDNTSVKVTENTTYVLTAIDDNGDTITCPAPVTVEDPEPVFSCEKNVNFSISAASMKRGQSAQLAWSTTDVDTVSISVINATALSGTQTVSPSSDTTYTLTATRGSDKVTCPVSIDVSGGGGGGGSSSPRCDLDISDKKITLGEEITLTWDTSRATEVTLTDDRGEILFTTDDYLSKDKEDYYDGSINLKPTRDTEYTLLAEKGSRDEECKVEVEVEDTVVVLETRDQQPLVAGISLSQVPYTGFEAGPFMTYMFYILLVVWSLFITYLLVMRNKVATTGASVVDNKYENIASMKQAETVRPDVFTPSVMAKVVESQTAPANLPTGIPVAGQDVMKTVNTNPHQVGDALVTELENRAHSQKALLSSDSVRHFISTTEGSLERNEALDQVISEAKASYPLEDGWVVINEARMQNLCEVCQVNAQTKADIPFVPSTVPEGTGSLAEAIVTGNIVAAYEMIGNRPMFALADAASDLDSVYRNRKGATEAVSEMLTAESAKLSDEQITQMISALTGALDGTYTDEASAVKMAIMKAVKVVA